MGAFFKLDYANIMAYVTSKLYGAPRVRRRDLGEFLDALACEARRYLIPESNFDGWPDGIAQVASRAASQLRETSDFGERETLPAMIVERILEELRSELSDFSVFAPAVGATRESAMDCVVLRKREWRSIPRSCQVCFPGKRE